MALLDTAILIILGLGIYRGWKDGLLTSLLRLVESFLGIAIAYLLKGPISLLLIKYCPFFTFNGLLQGISSFNVLVYDGIAFLIATIIVTAIFKLLFKFTGIFNRILNLTFIFGAPNQIGGALVLFIRNYIFCFLIIFVISLLPTTKSYLDESTYSKKILYETPILSNATKNINNSLTEIYTMLNDLSDETKTDKELDESTLRILLQYNIISEDTAKKLYDDGKIKVDDFDTLIEEVNKGDKK